MPVRPRPTPPHERPLPQWSTESRKDLDRTKWWDQVQLRPLGLARVGRPRGEDSQPPFVPSTMVNRIAQGSGSDKAVGPSPAQTASGSLVSAALVAQTLHRPSSESLSAALVAQTLDRPSSESLSAALVAQTVSRSRSADFSIALQARVCQPLSIALQARGADCQPPSWRRLSIALQARVVSRSRSADCQPFPETQTAAVFPQLFSVAQSCRPLS
jgi:hypothetical protein